MTLDRAPPELGIVLKAAPLHEADLMVTLYTETLGRVQAIARNARKSQRRFSGALSMLVLGRFQLGPKPRGDIWGLDSGEVVQEWTHLAYDVASHAHAGYACELVGALLPSESPEPAVLPLVTSLWDSLATNGASPGALRVFELALLQANGQQPQFAECASCGTFELPAPGTVFDPSRGGVICPDCAPASPRGARPIDPATRAYLRRAVECDTVGEGASLDRDESIAHPTRAAGRDAMIAMLVSLVGKPLRSLEYIAKLGAARRSP